MNFSSLEKREIHIIQEIFYFDMNMNNFCLFKS